MKRLASLLLFALFLLPLAACAPKEVPDALAPADSVRVGGMTGPTSIGMLQLLSTYRESSSKQALDFTLAGSADELSPKLARGELDLAAIPANLAAILYENTSGAICTLSVNTLGVLSILENGGDSIQSLEDLRGKTIYASGKGSVPEYSLRHLLTKAGLDPDQDLTIEFRSEPAEIVSLLASGQGSIAMLPQPYVTVAQSKLPALRIALDLSTVWTEAEPDSSLITGVLVGRREFVEQNPKLIAAFLSDYKFSIDYANENPAEVALLCEEYEILKAPIAEKAIPHCNLAYQDGKEMKTALSGYLEVLYAQNPAAVGGTLPDEAFYYLP